MNMFLAKKYYFKWREIIENNRYNEWKEIQDELDNEIDFAVQEFMESEHWCWNCKYSECEVHKPVQPKAPGIKKIKCDGKTQRGRNCHYPAICFTNGKQFCQFHC
jgi:hypothetical protein